MNDCAFLVLCGDKRQEYIFYSLQNKRLPVLSYMLDSFPKSKVSLYDLTKLCNIFICPTPFTKDDIYLHSTNKDSNKVLINDFLEMLEPNSIIFGGGIPNWVIDYCKSNNIIIFDFLKINDFIKINCSDTAEGLIGNIITSTPFRIEHSKCLVCGYGNCGKEICSLLKLFNADITVLESKNSLFHTTEPAPLNIYSSLENLNLSVFDIIINTIPSNIFTKKLSDTISKDCYIYDIASSPFGFSNEVFSSLNHAIRLPGIPGKICPLSSGYSMAQIIINSLERM